MQIKLAATGPSMWFLGEPRNYSVALNFVNTGPVEVDFNNLPTSDQKKVLISLQKGQIESDVKYQDLYKEWVKTNTPLEEEDPSNPAEAIRQATERNQARFLALKARVAEKEQKIKERCEYLLTKNIRSLKSALVGEQDIKMLQKMLMMERVNKKRKGAMKYLEEKIRQMADSRYKKIQKEVAKQLKTQRVPQETITSDVIESEEETIVLTPNDLIFAAMAKE